MASVQNRVYPLGEYGEIRTSTVRATNVVATTLTGSATLGASTFSGSALALNGATTLTGFPAGQAIFQYQPVVIQGNTGSTYISGATARAQEGIIGVSAAAYTTGQTVTIITEGLVPFQTSGSSPITKGAYVINTTSGSFLTGSNRFLVEDFNNAVGLAASGSSILGIAFITGSSAANTLTHVWVKPQCGTS